MANRTWDPFSPHSGAASKPKGLGVKTDDQPDDSWRKAEIEQYAIDRGIDVSGMTKAEMLDAVS